MNHESNINNFQAEPVLTLSPENYQQLITLEKSTDYEYTRCLGTEPEEVIGESDFGDMF